MSDVEVKPGQIWTDNDKRSGGRQVKVAYIDGVYAHCQVRYGPTCHWASATRIRIDRFKPTSTGYKLYSEA